MRLLLLVCLSACTPHDLPANKETPTGDGSADDTAATDGSDGTDGADGNGDDTQAPDDTAPPDDTALPPPDPVDLRADGGQPWSFDEGSVAIPGGGTLGYVRYTPDSPVTDAVIILSHGFSRASDQMAGLAGRLASWGFIVLTPDLLHSSVFDVDPVANAEELGILVDSLGAPPTLWAGHSNGGIVALLAAADAAEPKGLLGLDPVESFGADNTSVGAGLPSSIWVGALLGESTYCNANNSGAAPYAAAPGATLWRVTEADHCDFEDPTDSLCTFSCGGTNDAFSDAEINDTIGAFAVAWAFGAGLGDPAVDEWWTDGGYWNAEFQAAGAISAP